LYRDEIITALGRKVVLETMLLANMARSSQWPDIRATLEAMCDSGELVKHDTSKGAAYRMATIAPS
jgi:hypothetical protein